MTVRSDTKNYDIFKGVVTVILLIIIVILLLQGRPAPTVEKLPEPTLPPATPQAVELALPTIHLPTVGEDGSVSLSGTGQPGATVELWAGDVNLGQVLVAADGTWSWDGTLDPGDHQLTARTVDAAGETLNETEALALNVPEPAVEIALPTIDPPTVGEDGSVSLSGTGEPGATVELWAGDAKLGEVVVAADGTWSWDGSLDPGDYQLTARTVDAAGQALNETTALALNVPEPAVEIALPTLDPPTVGEDGSVSLSGTGEPGATVELWAGNVKLGEVIVGPEGTWSWDGSLDPGDYQLTAHTVDAAGETLNETEALTLSVPEPAVEVALPTLDPPTVGEDGSVSLSGTGEPGATAELWAGDVKLGEVVVGADGTWSWDGTLDPGDYALTARTVDTAGETLNETEALALSVPEPAVEIALPVLYPPEIDDDGSVSLSGAGQPRTTLEIVEDGVVVGTAEVAETGTWVFVYKASAGAHQLAVRDQANPEVASAEASIEVPAAAEPSAQSGEGEGYIVQRGDSLAALAERFYGDWKLWRLIFEATNERAAEDPSFHVIENPRLIRPGWKLWIPAQVSSR